nr:hypothetical protein [Frankia sp. AvcI1]
MPIILASAQARPAQPRQRRRRQPEAAPRAGSEQADSGEERQAKQLAGSVDQVRVGREGSRARASHRPVGDGDDGGCRHRDEPHPQVLAQGHQAAVRPQLLGAGDDRGRTTRHHAERRVGDTAPARPGEQQGRQQAQRDGGQRDRRQGKRRTQDRAQLRDVQIASHQDAEDGLRSADGRGREIPPDHPTERKKGPHQQRDDELWRGHPHDFAHLAEEIAAHHEKNPGAAISVAPW